jgi:hypothetical protein
MWCRRTRRGTGATGVPPGRRRRRMAATGRVASTAVRHDAREGAWWSGEAELGQASFVERAENGARGPTK